MKQYYLVINKEKSDLFIIDQLTTQQVTPQTPVWTEGMSDWVLAQQVTELSLLFTSQAPIPEASRPTATSQAPAYSAAPAYGSPQLQISNTQVIPPNHLVRSTLATLFYCIPEGVVAIACPTQVSSCFQQGNHAGANEPSRNARKWVIISAIVAAAVWVIYLIILVAMGASILALGQC